MADRLAKKIRIFLDQREKEKHRFAALESIIGIKKTYDRN